ncbi:hypothetical protein BH11PLA2_BH11PLA2_42240 [soil metagenome]
MLKSLVVKLFTAVLVAASAGSAHAAFSISVASTGGPAFPTYTSSSLSGAFIDVFDGVAFAGSDLLLSYNITNNPGAANFTINSLNLIYQNNATPISYKVTITESAATYPAGSSLNGFTSYAATGNPAGTFNSLTTFTGTGANTIAFPTVNFSNSPVNFISGTTFTSLGSPGMIQLELNVNQAANSNSNFGAGQGVVGIEAIGVPVPATALFGLFAVPTLAIIRRRKAKITA